MARRLSRRSLAQYVADGLLAGHQVKTIKRLAAYLIESRRTKELELIVRDVQYLLAEKGVVVGSVVSAFELTAAAKKEIERFVRHKSGTKEVSLESQVDPDVLGGIRISLPGQEIDQTIARQLTVLKTRFRKA